MSQTANSVASSGGDTSPLSAVPHLNAPPAVPSVLQTNLQAQSVPQVSSQSKGMSFVQELTQGLATDKTKPSTSSVKVSQVLDNDGLNLNPWLYDLVNCGITNECIRNNFV